MGVLTQTEVVSSSSCTVGEAPLWHPDERRLYWVDAQAGRMRRYDPVSEVTEMCLDDEQIGGFTIQSDGTLLLFTASGDIITWAEGRLKFMFEDAVDGGFGDVIADPLGRVFAGVSVVKGEKGYVCRIERDGTINVILEGLQEPNGFAFSPDRTRIYMTDTKRRERYVFDYDPGTGDCTDMRTFTHNREALGMPDGMTVDAEGCIWSAQWNGGCVIRYTPNGKEDSRFELPVKKPSSVTFGGIDYTDVYVSTSIGDDWKDDSLGAGSLFRIRAGIRGIPEFFSRIGI